MNKEIIDLLHSMQDKYEEKFCCITNVFQSLVKYILENDKDKSKMTQAINKLITIQTKHEKYIEKLEGKNHE